MAAIADTIRKALRTGWMEEQSAAVIEGAAMRAATKHIKENLGTAIGKELDAAQVKEAAELVRPSVNSAIANANSWNENFALQLTGGAKPVVAPSEADKQAFLEKVDAMSEKARPVMHAAMQEALGEASAGITDAKFHEISKGKAGAAR